jgi:hypothetical protein
MRVLLAALLLAGSCAQLLDKPEDVTAVGESAKAGPKKPASAAEKRAAKLAAKKARKAHHKAIQEAYKEAYAPMGGAYEKTGGRRRAKTGSKEYQQMYGAIYMPDTAVPSKTSNMTDAEAAKQQFVESERAKRQYWMNKFVPGAYSPTTGADSDKPLTSDQIMDHYKHMQDGYKQMNAPSKEAPSGHESKMTDDKHASAASPASMQLAAQPKAQAHSASSASSGVAPSEDKASKSQSVAVTTNLGEEALAGISSWRFTLGVAAGFCLPAAFAFLKSARRAGMAARLAESDRPVEESQFHLLA